LIDSDTIARGIRAMMIDKIGGVGPSYGPKKSEPTTRKESTSRTADNVSISDEATQAALAARTAKIARDSVDTERTQKLAQVKERLERGDYDNFTDEQLSSIADKITDNFFGRA